jgi:hypothetical protein
MSVRVPDLLVMILYAGRPFEYSVASRTLFLSKRKERPPQAGVVEVLAMDSDSIWSCSLRSLYIIWGQGRHFVRVLRMGEQKGGRDSRDTEYADAE